MPLSFSLATLGVVALVMLSLSLEFFDEELPVWSHLYAVMAGVAIGIAFVAAFATPSDVRVVYA